MSRSPLPPQGTSQRQLRVGELIRRTLSEILAQGGLHDPDLDGVSVTVGEVRCSPDLQQATAFVMPLGGAGQDRLVAALRRNKPEIRRQVARATALKRVPDLRFEIDPTFDRMDAARRMFADERVRRDLGDGRGDGRGDGPGNGPEDRPGDAPE